MNTPHTPSRLTSNTTRRAFTLIELLVVIAIIAILAAILFPVFARARENARRASCQSNMKQILLGVMQYTQDYDEKFPGAHNEGSTLPTTGPNTGRGWYNNVQPYVKSWQLFKCPSDTAENAAAYTSPAVRISYIVNSQFGAGAAGGKSLASIESSATTVYLTDGMSQSDGITTTPTSPLKTSAGTLGLMTYANALEVSGSTDGNWGGPTPRHLETAVFGFADGHVKAARVSSYYGAADTPKGDCLNIAVGCR